MSFEKFSPQMHEGPTRVSTPRPNLFGLLTIDP